jgi:PST family polysaccharide transporter
VSGTARLAAGAGWLYAYRWAERLLDFLAIVVLARLLAPDDFGLVAIAASFATIVEGLSALDVDKALIRTREDDEALYDTAWTLSVLRGVIAGAVMVGAASLMADARMAAVLRVLALAPVLNGLRNPRFVTFERELIYSRLALLTVGAKIASVAVMLAVAAATRSYWALVLGQLVYSLVTMLLSYLVRPHWPRPSFSRVGPLFAFSGWLSLTSAVTSLSMETDKLIVGGLLGVRDAGLYFMTQRVGVLPTQELLSPLQRLLFPAFSEVVDDAGRLRRAVLESVNVLGALALPAGFGFAFVARDFVRLALGESWMPIVSLLQVFAPYLGIRSTLSMTLPCVLALGRTRLLFGVSLAYALVHVPVFVAGTAWYGLTGAIWSLVLAGAFYTALNAWMLRETLGLPLRDLAAQLRRPAWATVAMAGGVLASRAVQGSAASTDADSPWTLLVTIAAGASAYGLSSWFLWKLDGRPPGFERRLAQILAR